MGRRFPPALASPGHDRNPLGCRAVLATPEDKSPAPEPRSRRSALIFVGTLAAIAIVVAVILLVTGGGGEDEGTSSDFADVTECQKVDAAQPKTVSLDAPDATEPTATGVEFVTSCGAFTVTFDPASPKTAASMQYLAEQGVYDGTGFHRIVPGFVIQGGDPAADGSGGPGYSVTEAPPKDAKYTEGVVAMAKSGTEAPGTSGSQFFVVTGKDAGLPPDYAIAGKVTEGMDTVQRIADQGVQDGVPPKMPIVIESATPVQ
jgi:cyclophilin family peptidyl-prolyl cis-trans isomerase